MQTTIYTYLQRYLLKIRVKSFHYTEYKKSLTQRNLNVLFKNSKYLPSFNFNTTKKVLAPYYNVNNKIVLKRSKKQYCFGSIFNPIKNNRLLILIKTFVLFNEAEKLCKQKPLLNQNSFQVLSFFKLKKKSVSIVENTAFNFYNQKLASFSSKVPSRAWLGPTDVGPSWLGPKDYGWGYGLSSLSPTKGLSSMSPTTSFGRYGPFQRAEHGRVLRTRAQRDYGLKELVLVGSYGPYHALPKGPLSSMSPTITHHLREAEESPTTPKGSYYLWAWNQRAWVMVGLQELSSLRLWALWAWDLRSHNVHRTLPRRTHKLPKGLSSLSPITTYYHHHDFFHFAKLENLTLLKSFYNLYIYSYKKFILNKKGEGEWVCKQSSIAFPELTLVISKISNYEPLLLHNMLIFIDNFFFNGIKYVKQRKLINNTEYNFDNLITVLYVCQLHKKKPNKTAFKPFYKKIVYMANTKRVHYYLMRPLFTLTRLDTFYICKSLKLPIYPDQSNYKVDFLRNRVRKQILPAIRILLNPQFDTILCKFNESYV